MLYIVHAGVGARSHLKPSRVYEQNSSTASASPFFLFCFLFLFFFFLGGGGGEGGPEGVYQSKFSSQTFFASQLPLSKSYSHHLNSLIFFADAAVMASKKCQIICLTSSGYFWHKTIRGFYSNIITSKNALDQLCVLVNQNGFCDTHLLLLLLLLLSGEL